WFVRSEAWYARLGREPLWRSIWQCEAAAEIRGPEETPDAPALGGDGSRVAGARDNCRRYRIGFPLSRAIGAGSAGKKRRRAAVREPQPRSRERLFRRWHPGRSADAPS